MTTSAILIVASALAAAAADDNRGFVGQWQAVQGASELLDLNADGTVKATNPGVNDYLGVYKINGRTLEIVYNTAFGQKLSSMTISGKSESEMILQNQLTLKHVVYRRVVNGITPLPNDLRQYPNLIVGSWQSLSSKEQLRITQDGRIVAVGDDAREYTGLYQIFGDVLEYTLNLPAGLQKAKMTIVSLTPTEMHLLSPSNKPATYKRAN